MYDDFEDLDILDDDTDELFDEKPPNSRFRLIAGILGVLIIFAIITVAAFLLFSDPDTASNTTADDNALKISSNQTATVLAQQAFIGESLTQTAEAMVVVVDPTELPPTAAPTEEASPTLNAAAATVQAAYTQAAAMQSTASSEVTPTATDTDTDALPDTGLIDDLGIPGIILFSTLLFLVIIISRRVRTNNT